MVFEIYAKNSKIKDFYSFNIDLICTSVCLMKTSRTPTDVSLKARSRGSVGLNMEHAQYELSRMLAEISGDARNIKSTEYNCDRARENVP